VSESKTQITRPEGIAADNYLDLLNLLSEVVASTTDLKSILNATVRLIQRLLQVQRCSILLVDESSDNLHVGAAAGIPGDVLERIRIRMGDGIAGRVAQTGEPVFSQNVDDSDSQGMGEKPDERYTTSSFISVPIRHQDRTYGVINATNKFDRGQLSAQDLEMLLSVSRFLALTVMTNRLHAETEMLHEHTSRTMESLPIGVLTLREDGMVLTANPAAVRLLGLCGSAFEGGRGIFECMDRPLGAQVAAMLQSAMRAGISQQHEIERPARDATVPLRLTCQRIGTPKGALSEAVLLVEDLTLRREVQELRRLDELKSNFIAMVSHELRTPLTSIRGSIHLLESYYAASLNETHLNLLRIIGNNTERLVAIVNNILDISLLDNNTMHIEATPQDLNAIMRRCAADFIPRAREKNIEFIVQPCDHALAVYGDSDRLAQILNHILDNALKYTPSFGTVTLRAGAQEDNAVIDVIDSGAGIPPEMRDKIFERFVQAENTMTRQSSGTGLGLYLARALASLHGGTIRLLDSEEKGAHLQILIPLETSARSLKFQDTMF